MARSARHPRMAASSARMAAETARNVSRAPRETRPALRRWRPWPSLCQPPLRPSDTPSAKSPEQCCVGVAHRFGCLVAAPQGNACRFGVLEVSRDVVHGAAKYTPEMRPTVVHFNDSEPFRVAGDAARLFRQFTFRALAGRLARIDESAGQLPHLAKAIEYQHDAVTAARDHHREFGGGQRCNRALRGFVERDEMRQRHSDLPGLEADGENAGHGASLAVPHATGTRPVASTSHDSPPSDRCRT